MITKEWNKAIKEPLITDEEWTKVVERGPENGYTLKELQESIRRNGVGYYFSDDIHNVRRETPTKLALDNFAWPLG